MVHARLRIVLAALTLSLLATLFSVTPAQAAVTTYACNPTPTTWDTVAAWPDGTVAEARRCLQHDSATGKVRERLEARVRKGGTAIAGADWDFDDNDDFRGLYVSVEISGGATVVAADNFDDVFNASYVVKYTPFGCWGGSSQTYFGFDNDWRVTPPGLPRSGYKFGGSDHTTDGLVAC